MKTAILVGFLLTSLLAMGVGDSFSSGNSATGEPGDLLVISGMVRDKQGNGVKEATISIFVDGETVETSEPVLSKEGGMYHAEIRMPTGRLSNASIAVEVTKPSYAGSGKLALDTFAEGKRTNGGKHPYLGNKNVTLSRTTSSAFWIATLVLAAVYALIAFEVMHRTLAALLGAGVLLFITYTMGTFKEDWVILRFEDAVKAIDMNVIFLLMAMMMIVGVLKKTGVFQWLAFKSYQIARGNVFALCCILCTLTAITSSFLDNVTTMILVIPVTVNIALVLGINPITLLLPEVFASNVGGTATLIGDPPNIMIGSYAELTFLDFVMNLALVCAICLAVTIIYFMFWYKKAYVKSASVDPVATIKQLRAEYKITNGTLLIYCSVMLAITVFLFIIHGALHMEPCIAAMLGATVLLIISRVSIVQILEHDIEWPTLIFFMMLFMVVAGAEETGLIQVIADWVNHMSRGSVVVAVLMILWVSALASAIIDNIPFTATMLPIVAYLNQVVPGAENGILWWALALGACLGGNGTMIGASANVVTVGIAESLGYRITFMDYFKTAFVPMLITVVISSLWLLLVAM